MTPFADKTEEEFSALNTLQVTKQTLKEHEKMAAQEKKLSFKKINPRSLPTSFDWREKGAVTDVKNQEQCGSCWAFATVAATEGVNFMTNGKLESLSEQELVSCDSVDQGCNGGLPSNAFSYMAKNAVGFELESDYPYTAADGTCKAKSSLEKVFLDKASNGYKAISQDEDEIAQALMDDGPLAIGINATPMQFYSGGISNPWICNPKALDHGVAIVAFGEDSGTKYWTIKNSWGSSWGEKGYYRIVRGKGKCGVNQMVTAAKVSKSLGNEQVFI
jgi:C1A family cysteine protease